MFTVSQLSKKLALKMYKTIENGVIFLLMIVQSEA